MTPRPAAPATGASREGARPPPWEFGVMPAAVGLVGAVALGWLVAANPDLFHLEIRPTAFALLGAVAAAGLILMVLLSPRAALVCVLAIVYLNLSDALIRALGLPSVLQLLGVPILLSGWVHGGRGAPSHVLGQPLTWLLAGYVFVLFASTAWAERPELADERVAEATKALAVYVMVLLLVGSRERVRLATWTLTAAGALLGLLGILRLLAGADAGVLAGLARAERGQIYGDVFGRRLTGPLGDANFFAQILVVLVPLGLYLAWTERALRARLAALACLALILAALVLTYSRGGALALGVVIVASLLAHGIGWRRILAGALVLVVAALVLLPSGFTRRLTTISQFFPGDDTYVEMDSSFEERLLWMGTAWEMFVANPAVGVGAGNYTARFGEYAERRSSAAREYKDPDAVHYPHNLYLEVAAETGAVGLATFLAVLAVVFLTLERARPAFRERGDEAMAGFARGLEIAVAGYLLSSLFLHGHFQRYLWVLFGLAAATGALALRSRAPAPPVSVGTIGG